MLSFLRKRSTRPAQPVVALLLVSLACLAALGISRSPVFYPIPVKVNATTGEPVEPVSLGWDATLPDLMAADAYAQCAVAAAREVSVPQIADMTGNDEYLRWLQGKMKQSACRKGKIPTTEEAWVVGRSEHSRCNADPRTLSPGTIAPIRESLEASETPHAALGLVQLNDLYVSGVLKNTPSAGGALSVARMEFQYAHLNLCMALRLRSQLESADVLFATAEDQSALLGLIQERAELAVAYYALLTKVIGSPEPMPAGGFAIQNVQSWLPIVAAWARIAGDVTLKNLGLDFDLAIKTHIEATTRFAKELQRKASERKASRSDPVLARGNWGKGSPRARLLSLLYGGDALGTTEAASQPPGRGLGGVRADGQPTSYVSTPTDDLRVGLLFRIARTADVLRFRLNPTVAGGGIDTVASAKTLYEAAEVDLRARSCAELTPGHCDPASIAAEVALEGDPQRFELFKHYRIERKHGDALIAQFSEAFSQIFAGPAPTERIYEGAFKLDGKVTESLDSAGARWLHVSNDFRAVPYEGFELGAGFASLHYLPRVPSLNAQAELQGFISFPAPNAGHRASLVRSWKALRDMGAVPVLAFAREALTTGSQVIVGSEAQPRPPAVAVGSTATDALGRVQAAIGITSIAVRPVPDPGSSLLFQATRADGSRGYEVEVTTLPTDGFGKLAVAPYSRYLASAATSTRSEILGASQAALLAAPHEAAVRTEYRLPGGLSLESHRFSFWEKSAPDLPALLFLLSDHGAQPSYLSAFRAGLTMQEAHFFSLGGTLNLLAEQSWATDDEDWSKPAYDVFGKRVNETPVGNASLLGGQSDEEAYSYYIRLAREAATAAAAGIQASIEGLSSEALSEAQDSAGEAQAQGLTSLELEALCGPSQSCGVATVSFRPPINSDACDSLASDPDLTHTLSGDVLSESKGTSLVAIAKKTCKKLMDQLSLTVPEFAIPSTALKAGRPPTEPPSFGGGELSQVLTAAWAAARKIDLTARSATPQRGTAVELAVSLGAAVARAYDAADLAQTSFSKAKADIDRELACELDAQSCATGYRCNGAFSDSLGELNQLCGHLQQLSTSQTASANAQARWCSPEREAEAASYTVQLQFITTGCYFQEEPEVERGCICTNIVAAQNVTKTTTESTTILGGCSTKPNDPNSVDCKKVSCTWDAKCMNSGGTYEASKSKSSDACANCTRKTVGEIPDCPTHPPKDPTCPAGLIKCEGSSGASADFMPIAVQAARCEDARTLAKATSDANAPLEAAIAELQGHLLRSIASAKLDLPGKLQEARSDHERVLSQVAEVQNAATSQFANHLITVTDAVNSVATADAQLASLQGREQVIRDRLALDTTIRSSDASLRRLLRTTFQSTDVWRARALLADARQLSLAARRAVEGRFVVNLSEMQQDQAFVSAPSLWADDVYASDLDAPAVVGLSPREKSAGSVYANQLLDYVTNLERFVQGYSSTYPTSQVQGDAELVSLPAPASGPTGMTPSLSSLQPGGIGWRFSCPNAAATSIAYPASGDFRTACLNLDGSRSAPTTATYAFRLDPWGRRVGSLANPPYANRYNVRWDRLAVNLSGTAVRSCSRAAGPESCSVRYKLTHTGPAAVVDFGGRWRLQHVPAASVEGGRALAVEVQLDPLAKSFNDATVTNVARREFLGRPIEGTYELTLQLEADVDIRNITGIQLLTETDYWVAQDLGQEVSQKRGLTSLFSPTDLGKKLVAWFSPNRATIVEGAKVAALGDQSGRGASATQTLETARPAFLQGADGLKSLLFTGSERLNANVTAHLATSTRSALAVWYRPTSGMSGCCGTLLQLLPTSNQMMLQDSGDTLVKLSVPGVAPVSTGGTDLSWHFWVVQSVLSGSSVRQVTIFRDGQPQPLTTVPQGITNSIASQDLLLIGNSLSMDAGLKGEVGNVFVFDDLLTEREIVQLGSFEARH